MTSNCSGAQTALGHRRVGDVRIPAVPRSPFPLSPCPLFQSLHLATLRLRVYRAGPVVTLSLGPLTTWEGSGEDPLSAPDDVL